MSISQLTEKKKKVEEEKLKKKEKKNIPLGEVKTGGGEEIELNFTPTRTRDEAENRYVASFTTRHHTPPFSPPQFILGRRDEN